MSRLAEELAEKYGFTNEGYERSDFVAALEELQERCAKEADLLEREYVAATVLGIETGRTPTQCAREDAKAQLARQLAARIRNL